MKHINMEFQTKYMDFLNEKLKLQEVKVGDFYKRRPYGSTQVFCVLGMKGGDVYLKHIKFGDIKLVDKGVFIGDYIQVDTLSKEQNILWKRTLKKKPMSKDAEAWDLPWRKNPVNEVFVYCDSCGYESGDFESVEALKNKVKADGGIYGEAEQGKSNICPKCGKENTLIED